jgi:hypothetical protein
MSVECTDLAGPRLAHQLDALAEAIAALAASVQQPASRSPASNSSRTARARRRSRSRSTTATHSKRRRPPRRSTTSWPPPIAPARPGQRASRMSTSRGFGGGASAPTRPSAEAARRWPSATFRVDCACGAWITCHAMGALPARCAFCGRPCPAGIPARLRALLSARGLTAVALAERLGLGRTTVWEWGAAVRPIPLPASGRAPRPSPSRPGSWPTVPPQRQPRRRACRSLKGRPRRRRLRPAP